MFAIKATCERTIYLSRGRVVFDGPTDAAIQLYEKESRPGHRPLGHGRLGDDPSMRPIHVANIEVVDESGRPAHLFRPRRADAHPDPLPRQPAPA